MLSPNLEQTLHRALAYANERRHEYATLEHLLLALTEDQDAVAVLRACGVDLERLRARPHATTSTTSSANLVGSAPSTTPSRPPASSACCSAPRSTCNPPAARR